jgi:hypothetical protein
MAAKTQRNSAFLPIATLLIVFMFSGYLNYTIYREVTHVRTGECSVSNCVFLGDNCIRSNNECYDGIMRYSMRTGSRVYPVAQLFKTNQFECKINSTLHCQWDERRPETVTTDSVLTNTIIGFCFFNLLFVSMEIILAYMIIVALRQRCHS